MAGGWSWWPRQLATKTTIPSVQLTRNEGSKCSLETLVNCLCFELMIPFLVNIPWNFFSQEITSSKWNDRKSPSGRNTRARARNSRLRQLKNNSRKRVYLYPWRRKHLSRIEQIKLCQNLKCFSFRHNKNENDGYGRTMPIWWDYLRNTGLKSSPKIKSINTAYISW